MKKALLLSVAAAMLLPLGMTSSAIARPSPHPHYRSGSRHRVYRRARRAHRPYVRVPVYRPRRAPVVVVTPPPPPVVVVEPPPPRRVVVRRSEPAVVARPAPAPEPEQRTLLGVNVRLSGASLEGEKVGLSSAENPTMGGAGVALKARFDESFGFELSVDGLGSDGEQVDQTTVPVMGSLTYHLFPNSRVQPYGLVGAGVHFTRLSYLDGRYNHDITEFAGQIGAGVEVFLTEHLAISADLRAQTVFKDLDTQAKIRTDCLNQVGSMTGFCDNIHDADPGDKVNLGVQFQAGATWYF
ncbi:MAG: hypothetical protein CSA66_00195 [Proteobacteria bacterium]|nr:MAG: hypothetical protein CSA66_00195 [Pseudomonadota bacterium]